MIALRRLAPAVCAMLLVFGLPAVAQTTQPQKGPGSPRNIKCTGGRLIHARVAALDAPFFVNRLGAAMAEGMTFALERDIVRLGDACPAGWCARARLREGKRPRPIVLRANEGDCLHIEFTNLLSSAPTPLATSPVIGGGTTLTQPSTRYASIHIAGVQVFDIQDDGTFVASNPNSIAAPGETRHYYVRATQQGTFMLNSQGASWGGQNVPNDGAQVTAGLFGALNVEPRDAVWLRSQVTRDEMLRARDKTKGNDGFTNKGQPLLDFKSPILRMLQQNTDGSWELTHTDLTAVIAGPESNGYMFPPSTDPNTSPVPYEPERRRPFREFTIEYHELSDAVQAFPIYGNGSKVAVTLGAAGDAFAINYGAGGIGSEILANRFGLGPMNSCADCRFEEFFLSSWTVGDPAMVVDYPANSPCFDQSLNHSVVTSSAMNSVPCTPGVAGNAPEGIIPQRKATKAHYPDDPSNIYHSYINDRVIFRTLHAGTGVSHVHHLHAHQWFHSPNSDGSTYLDSQLINPGSAYTMEIAHLGSGNLNKVVGDSIFHCHFYPHFAAGMWAHWRSHDTFELGTELDGDGRPRTDGWNRAQPDGEIVAGTPIPALVPMPGLAMAPMPARVRVVPYADPNNPTGPPVGYRAEVHPDDLKAGINPGFPFFIPGIAGTRAPHPPLDFAVDNGKELNGGLPRHILVNARITEEEHTYLNFSKDMDDVNAFRLPEQGTVEEQVAMAYHEQCTHETFTSLGAPGKFRTNGRPRVPGAPYANPGVVSDSDGDACDPPKRETQYKAAVIQTDLVINKLGWHYPQSRFLTLWQDVIPTFNGTRTPEPFFIRTDADTAVTYWHTNLVPDYYLLDDYQVRTPTDIIGQHIHLVKFDVTSSDGAANGYNYEDGTLSYQDVQHRISGINKCGGLAAGRDSITPCDPKNPNKTGRITLTPEPPPAGICPDPNEVHCKSWLGAQTTVQRWFAESLSTDADKVNGERTIRTVFTHDHFGPSTHQQVGLYAAVLIEPSESKWYLNDGARTPMHTRDDGGPTSWEAIIETPGATPKGKPNAEPEVNPKNTYREFAIALQDFQFAYQPNSINQPKVFNGTDTDANGTPISVPGGESWVDTKNAIEPANGVNPTGTNPQPQPQIVSAGPTAGTLSFNYRQEPLPFRVQGAGTPGDPRSTDLSYVFSSNVPRNNTKMGTQPVGGSPICTANCPPAPTNPLYSIFKFPPPLTPGVLGGDPYTPLLRAYEGDNVQIRVVVGAHMLPHAFTIHGLKWLFEPSFADSGYRSTQSMGISEHFEFVFTMPRASPSPNPQYPWADYLYMPDASNQKHGIVDGMWGLFRAYQSKQNHLATLSNNPNISPLPARPDGYSCPPNAPVRSFVVNAESPTGPLIYNNRGVGAAGIFPQSKIQNPNPLLYSWQSTTAPGGQPANMTPNTTEPLILRANAGDCISLTLKNNFAGSRPVFGASGGSVAVFAPNIPLLTSQNAGITPALLSYDVMNSAGMNVGWNPDQTVGLGGTKTYRWYAGQTNFDAQGNVTGTPIEFGGVNLTPSDPLQQDIYGLVGGMVIEPPGSVPCYDQFQKAGLPVFYASANIYSSGTCTQPGKLHHREFVLVTQDDVTPKLGWPGGCYCAVPGAGFNPQTCSPCLTPAQTSTETFVVPLNTSVNYRTEPMAYRMNILPASLNRSPDLWRGFSDGIVLGEPETPIFAVARNTPTRLHLLHPGGAGDQQVLSLHGHVWQELPYTKTSTAIGDNRLSMHLGARDNYGTNTNYSIILDGNGGAGGREGAVGDYQYRTHPGNFISQGLWGIMRVGQGGSDIVKLVVAQLSGGGLQVAGSASAFVENSSNPKNGQRALTLSLFVRPIGSTGNGTPIGTLDVPPSGLFNTTLRTPSVPNLNTSEVLVVSPLGGQATRPIQFVELPATIEAVPAGPSPVGESIRFNNTARPTPADPKDNEVPENPNPRLPAPPPASENPPAQKPPAE